jgi:hypothetical protein
MPRKQSDATKLRAAKREISGLLSEKKTLMDKIYRLRLVGASMSNICFNFSQHPNDRFTENERETFRRCYREWDKVKNG